VLDTGHRLRIPDEKMQRLYDAAVRSLILHSPDEAYSGPYTDRRFWFRDAAFLCEAMLGVGLHDRVRRVIEHFPARQDMRGYFRSQEGEWDSNGAAIWTMDRYRRLSGNTLPDELVHAVAKGARWIRKQRLSEELEVPHAGLLPAGFSAEHLGPNDDYYWDDFWSVAGLRSAGSILRRHGDEEAAAQWEREAASLRAAVDRSIERTAARRDRSGVPASPYRRMDAGAIGSIVAGYPLRLWSRRDPRLLATVEYLLERCMVRCGFFQDMIHSGINAYLTLHLAQVLLRAEDPRWFDLMRTVADLASLTGQWPGIIHPRTGGGCMGDGQHLWASAEWVLMLRHCFVREEGARLVIGSGIPASWLRVGEPMEPGPVPTPFGPVTVRVEPGADNALVSWEGDWRAEAPPIEVKLPGCAATIVRRGERSSVEVALPEEARRRTEVAK
jgi:hypothetical protein